MTGQRGWTTGRLAVAGGLAAAAALAGGLLFISRFGAQGGAASPAMAVGFGLFVIGMVVFCAALVALLGIGLGEAVARHGWPPVTVAICAPLVAAWGLWGIGAVGYAVPAVVSLVLIGGVVAALR